MEIFFFMQNNRTRGKKGKERKNNALSPFSSGFVSFVCCLLVCFGGNLHLCFSGD